MTRILFITDLHKRYQDSSSIKGQIEVQRKIQEDIIAFNKANGVTHNVIAGDWYDRGFHGLGQAYGEMEMDKRLSESVNGNVYLCVGNHFYLERDENPEMYIIQPNAFIRPQVSIPVPDKPVFNMVQTLQLGPVQIDFFHFNKINKDYISYRKPETTFHIGVYHDDSVVPGWVREQEGYTGSSTQTYFNQIYANIDLAVHGHIHTKIGVTNISLADGRKVPLIIPGSLGITQNKEIFKHTSVKLPIIDIDDDGNVSLRMADFSTHLNDLRFHETKKKKKNPLVTAGIIASGKMDMLTGNTALQSLPAFMSQKGYEGRHLNLINAALGNQLNIATAVRILAEVDENKHE